MGLRESTRAKHAAARARAEGKFWGLGPTEDAGFARSVPPWSREGTAAAGTLDGRAPRCGYNRGRAVDAAVCPAGAHSTALFVSGPTRRARRLRVTTAGSTLDCCLPDGRASVLEGRAS